MSFYGEFGRTCGLNLDIIWELQAYILRGKTWMARNGQVRELRVFVVALEAPCVPQSLIIDGYNDVGIGQKH